MVGRAKSDRVDDMIESMMNYVIVIYIYISETDVLFYKGKMKMERRP